MGKTEILELGLSQFFCPKNEDVVFANIKLSHFARKNVSHSISSENTVLIWSERHDRLVVYRNTLMCRLSSEIMPLEAPCHDAPDLPFVNF